LKSPWFRIVLNRSDPPLAAAGGIHAAFSSRWLAQPSEVQVFQGYESHRLLFLV
jgi:hypothetical protein